MKTVEQIIEHIDSTKNLGTLSTIGDLVMFLPYKQVTQKHYLKEGTTKDEWDKLCLPLTEEVVIKEMREYMEFALEKAQKHRGLSASRSISHFINWLFILEDTELLEFADNDGNYQNYGCPILKKICDKYGFKYPEDEGMQNMAKGLPCRPDCDEGCGEQVSSNIAFSPEAAVSERVYNRRQEKAKRRVKDFYCPNCGYVETGGTASVEVTFTDKKTGKPITRRIIRSCPRCQTNMVMRNPNKGEKRK